MTVSLLRERVAEALHKMAFHDSPMHWRKPHPDWPDGVHMLPEKSKEAWREAADRFLNEVGPSLGLRVEVDD